MDILNVKKLKKEDVIDRKIAYCGLSYGYWRGLFPVIDLMLNFEELGKPREFAKKPNWQELYKGWLWGKVKNKSGVEYFRLQQLGDDNVGIDGIACWCKPKPCHCDVIVRAVEWASG